MKNIFFLLLIFVQIKLQAQVKPETDLSLLQGIWVCTSNQDSSTASYKLVKNNDCLEFYVSNDGGSDTYDMMVGFQSFASNSAKIEWMYVDSLKENGLYYTEIIDKNDIKGDGSVRRSFCVIASYYECDGERLSINGNSALYEFSKINQLSHDILTKLYERGKKDQRNYIKEFLDINVREITTPISIIYSVPEQATANRLKKGDIVNIWEEKGDWIKVDYGVEEPAWVKKVDVQ
ncbi:MAG: hypothetical protein ABI315_09020 [Bacteroidia bacterium]